MTEAIFPENHEMKISVRVPKVLYDNWKSILYLLKNVSERSYFISRVIDPEMDVLKYFKNALI